MAEWMSCCRVAAALGADNLAARAVFGLPLAGIIVALAVIDLQRMVLPDGLNLLLAALGAIQSVAFGQPALIDAALGTLAASSILMLLITLYRGFRGVDGLGFGDVKFVAAAAIWIGWQGLPLMLSVASTTALAFVTIRAFRERKLDRMAPLPFGPFLGLGTLFAWVAMVTS